MNEEPKYLLPKRKVEFNVPDLEFSVIAQDGKAYAVVTRVSDDEIIFCQALVFSFDRHGYTEEASPESFLRTQVSNFVGNEIAEINAVLPTLLFEYRRAKHGTSNS